MQISKYRLCRKPAEGKIIETKIIDGLEVATYETAGGNREARILEPEEMIKLKQVKITRAEGLINECGNPVILKGERLRISKDHDWQYINPILQANTVFMQWGQTAPERGYDKCDFEVLWQGGYKWAGRFDLQKGGTDAGEIFSDSFRSRILFYAGYNKPQYMTDERYNRLIDDYESKGFARHILKYCEL